MPTDVTTACEVCSKSASIHIHLARNRKWIEIHHLCDQHGNEMLAKHFSAEPVNLNAELRLNAAICCDIELLITRTDGPHDGIYYLREDSGSLRFCSTMGYCESAALYLNLQHTTQPRPQTYKVFSTTIDALGGRLQDVVIDGLTESGANFRAILRIRKADDLVAVDVRPSDAINLAIVCDVPIWVSKDLLAAGMSKAVGNE